VAEIVLESVSLRLELLKRHHDDPIPLGECGCSFLIIASVAAALYLIFQLTFTYSSLWPSPASIDSITVGKELIT
jgi:hypothetical protein